MHILFLFVFCLPLWSATTQEIEEAKRSIKTLIQPLLPGAKRTKPASLKNFNINGCEKFAINWRDVLMMRTSVVLQYKFKEGCDIEGAITPKLLQPFPVALTIRNLPPYTKLETENKITASLETKPIMNLEMRKGILTGQKGAVKFEADYQIQINPISDTEPVEKDLGGEIRITEIYGTKTNLREKIKLR